MDILKKQPYIPFNRFVRCVADPIVLHQFLLKLLEPFEDTPAYRLGIIDKNGKVLRRPAQFKTKEEKAAFGTIDIVFNHLKKIIKQVPSSRNKLASLAAGLFALKEWNNIEIFQDSEYLEESFEDFLSEMQERKEDQEPLEQLWEEVHRIQISREMAREVGNTLNVDWDQFDIEQFRRGLEVEQEHHRADDWNVVNTIEDIGKIALAHLEEIPDYYSQLEKMERKVEEDVPANSVASGGVAGMHEPIVRVRKRKLRTFGNY